MVNPYTEVEDIRTFNCLLDPNDLVWHRDKSDRMVEVLNGNNWYFQFENNLPFKLEISDIINIPKMIYHRIYKKGNNDLILRIKEV